MSPLEAIGKLEKLKADIQNPAPFYERVSEPWARLARRVIEQTLVTLQPGDVPPASWQQQISEIAGRVTSEVLPEGEFGIVLSLPPRLTVLTPEQINEPEHFRLGNISVADVERWVAAGRGKASPDAPGKNLGEIDAGKSDLQIAWRVMYALKLQKPGWDRLLDVLRNFLGLEAEGIAELLYPQLLKAWMEHFTVRAQKDWAAYVHELVAAM